MSLAPATRFVLGDLEYTTHSADMVVSLGLLPAVNSLRILLPKSAQVSATAGDPASLDLDGGEGSETVLTGKVRSLRRRIAYTEVTAADGSADLGALRPAASYEKQSAKDVICALASDAGVDVGSVDLDLPMAFYAAHQGATAAEHVAYLARLAGATARLNADGEIDADGPPGGPADLALKYGREILEYEVRELAAPQVERVAIGNGPAGSTDSPDALRLSKDALPGGAPDPGSAAVWSMHAILRTATTAAAASQALDGEAASGAQVLSCRCFLLPKLRPGMVVEVQELPDGLASGPWQVTRVTHRLAGGAGSTRFEARSAPGGGGAGSLLGAVLSAVGGLL